MASSRPPRPFPPSSNALDEADDVELVALLLGAASRSDDDPLERARTLLDDAGGLARLATRPSDALAHAGAGPTRVAAAFELARRIARAEPDEPPHLGNAEQVAAYVRPRIGHLEHEEMWLAALDGRNRVRALRRLAMGGLHGCALGTRDVLRVALREGASAFVLAHNHPSGDPTPSREDVALTATVLAAAELVGVPLVDHVVVTRTAHRSILDGLGSALPLGTELGRALAAAWPGEKPTRRARATRP